tara:strand:- start:697 stop:2502 length:1806 start_codon:yes stop_codon:yes gene_type:complete
MQRPPKTPTSFFAAGLLPACLVPALFTPLLAASPQDVIFSIDYTGPTISLIDGSGVAPITEGDLLMPTPAGTPGLGPMPTPTVVIPHGLGGLGLFPGCAGHAPGTPCPVEVDALSFGTDRVYTPNGFSPGAVWFSTDRYVAGAALAVGPPNLASEGPMGDASSDLLTNVLLMPPAPMAPFASPPNHVGVVDGDGLPSGSGFTYPGLGTIEPNFPTPFLPSPGDTLDAAVVKPGFAIVPGVAFRTFFSMDAVWPDPLTGFPHSGTAAAHGFSSADVVVTAGGPPALFAAAPLLGLDLIGIQQDDLDALILWENGSGVFEPSVQPYDWLNGSSDMLLFSVRRGSPVIGAPDSAFGIPIEEGDILSTPIPTVLGGVSPFPSIFIAAENLGVGTMRSGTSMLAGFGEELDALSSPNQTLHDCDGNGIEDAVDISMGGVADLNMNGIPDPCESPLITVSSCFCPGGGFCGNSDPAAGCGNASGTGALLTASGSTVYALDDLVLTASNVAPLDFGLYFMGTTTVPPVFLADGLRCVGGSMFRFPPQLSSAAGTATLGPGIIAWTLANNPPAGWISIGSTWSFQYWYRDPGGPCGTTANLTNAVTATF